MIRRFQRLFPYLARYRWRLAVGMACLVLANYFEIRLAVLLGNGIDAAGLPLGPAAGLHRTVLAIFIILTLVIGLGAAVTRFWMRWLIIGVSRQVEFELRNDFFAHLTRLSASFYDRFRTGDVMSRATSDMEAIRVVMGPAIMYIANSLTMLPMTLVQMLHISGRLTALCLSPILLIGPLFYLFKQRINNRSRRAQELMSDMSTYLQETLSGARVIKTFAREQEQSERFDTISHSYVGQSLRLALLQSIFMPGLGLIIGLSVISLLWTGAVLIIRGEQSLGALVTFFTLLMATVWPMIAFGWVLAQVERGAASMKRVDEIFHAQPEVTGPPASATTGPTPVLQGAISLRNLSFTFPGATRPALQGLTLDLPAGATLGVTGPVGCGKSTLAALLARRYNPPRGGVLLDGVDILDWPVEALRSRIGIVDQEPFLFSDSILANIAYGLPEGQEEQNRQAVEQAAALAQIHDDIEQFPAAYGTLLGERGINLSGGQRQRAALARALARGPALLILDDALAAVDTHTEQAILQGLRGILGRHTTLIISHRISAVSLADVILYLEDGRVSEMGSHAELMERQGKYWALAQRQRLAQELEEGVAG